MAKRPAKKYVVFTDGTGAKLSEKALSRRIRVGWYEGHETWRLVDEPDTAVRPLHALPLYQAIHQLSPAEAAGRVQVQKAQGFAWHAGTFLAVMAFLGMPFWGVFWALAVVSHGASALPALKSVFADGFAQGVARMGGNEPFALESPDATQVPDAPPAPEPEATEAADDPLAARLAAEWGRLDALRPDLDDGVAAQLDAARAALDAVLTQRRTVLDHLAGEDEDDLAAEAAELETDVAGAPDQRTREVLAQALKALRARQAAVTELRAAEIRLGARARATLHQITSIRMSLVSTGAGSTQSGRTALSDLTDDLRHEARSAAELDEALAGARNHSGAGRRASETGS